MLYEGKSLQEKWKENCCSLFKNTTGNNQRECNPNNQSKNCVRERREKKCPPFMSGVQEKLLHCLCTKIWDRDLQSNDWSKPIFMPLPKQKEDITQCKICKTNDISKMLLKIIGEKNEGSYLESQNVKEQ